MDIANRFNPNAPKPTAEEMKKYALELQDELYKSDLSTSELAMLNKASGKTCCRCWIEAIEWTNRCNLHSNS